MGRPGRMMYLAMAFFGLKKKSIFLIPIMIIELIYFKIKVSNLLENGVKSVYLVNDFKVILSRRIQ